MMSLVARRYSIVSTVIAFVVAVLAGTSAAQAQTTYFWNAPTGGTGTWDTSTQNWSTASAGPVNYTWLNNGLETAQFANTAGTVSLGTNIIAYGININTANYQISASSGTTLTLAGPGGVINSGVTSIIGAEIAGTVGLTKTGNGTLTLTAANPYSGGTTVSGGKLIGNAQASGSPFGSGPVTLNGAALQLSGLSTSTTTAVGDFTVSGTNTSLIGTSNLSIDNSPTNGPATLAAGNLTRTGTGSALVILPFNGTLGAGENITFTNGNSLVTNTILPTWIVASASTSSAAADFTTYGANGVAVAAYSSTDLTTSSSTSVVNQTTSPTISGPVAAYALRANVPINLSGNALTMGSGSGQSGLILNSGASLSNGTISFGSTDDMVYVQGAVTLGASGDTTTMTSDSQINITALDAANLTIGATIANGTSPAKLVLAAPTIGSSLTINSANTYTGGTILSINTGTGTNVLIGSNAAFGTGKVTTILVPGSNSPQWQASGGVRTLANAFDFNGGLTFTGTDGFVFTGPITIINPTGASRTLNVSSSGQTTTFGASPGSSTATLGNPTSNGGDDVGKTMVLTAATGATLIMNDIAQDVAPGGGTAAGKVQVTGGGTVYLNAQNTYSGGTSLTGGGTIIPLTVSSNALPGASFTSGPFGTGTLEFNNGTNQHLRPTGGDRIISNPILMTTGFAMDNNPGETFNLTMAGPITMTNNRFISNGFSTNIVGPAGTLTVGDPSAPSTITLPTSSTFTLSFGGFFPIIVNDVIQDSGISAGLVNINPNASQLAAVTLNGANTYTGATTIGSASTGGGTARIGVSSVGSPGAITSGPFGTKTLVMAVTTPSATATVPTLIPAGADRTVANAIQMTGSFIAANDSATSFNLNLTGPITMQTANRSITNNMSGTLTLGASGSPSTIFLGNASTGRQLEFLASSANATTDVNDAIVNPTAGGSGSIRVTSGTVRFNNANTYSGGTTVAGGKLLVNNTTGSGTGTGAVTVSAGATLGGTGSMSGAITNNGTVAPGAIAGTPGTLTATGNFTDGANSHWAIELNGTAADKLAVGGNLSLAAVDILDVTGTGSGSSWTIASYTGTLTGTFDTLNIPSGYTISYGTGANSVITLNAPVVGLPGDFNNDGKVDAGDYVTWRKNENTNNALANDNGLGTPIGPAHYNLWRANFGKPPGAGSGGGLGGGAVPEPASMLLVTLAILVFPAIGSRRRSRK